MLGQRFEIRGLVDLDLLYQLARMVEASIPETKVYSPLGLVGELDCAVTAELDYWSGVFYRSRSIFSSRFSLRSLASSVRSSVVSPVLPPSRSARA